MKRVCREMSIEEFKDGYVTAPYPGLTGYAYKGEILSEETAKEIMEDILKEVSWIQQCDNGHPVLHMKDGRELYVDDTNDFPVPTNEDTST